MSDCDGCWVRDSAVSMTADVSDDDCQRNETHWPLGCRRRSLRASRVVTTTCRA